MPLQTDPRRELVWSRREHLTGGRHWFLVFLFAVALAGWLYPKAGLLLLPYVSILLAATMFILGLAINPAECMSSRNVPALILILSNNFLIMPALSYALGKIFFSSESPLFAGFVVLGALPTTVVTSIVWTHIARSNVSLSLAAGLASTLVSIGLTPVIVGLLLGRTFSLPVIDMIGRLFITVFLPVAGAQVLRKLAGPGVALSRWTPYVGRIMIVLMFLTAIAKSAAFITWSSLLAVSVAVAVLNALVSVVSLGGAKVLRIPPKDWMAVLFSSSQKTIAIGLLIGVVYLHYSGLVVLPMIVYHFTSQITASWFSCWQENQNQKA